MSATDANLLRERLGAGSGIVVRSGSKTLLRTGIELTPQRAPLARDVSARVFYRGGLCGVAVPAGSGWTLQGITTRRPFRTLVAACLFVAVRYLEASHR